MKAEMVLPDTIIRLVPNVVLLPKTMKYLSMGTKHMSPRNTALKRSAAKPRDVHNMIDIHILCDFKCYFATVITIYMRAE